MHAPATTHHTTSVNTTQNKRTTTVHYYTNSYTPLNYAHHLLSYHNKHQHTHTRTKRHTTTHRLHHNTTQLPTTRHKAVNNTPPRNAQHTHRPLPNHNHTHIPNKNHNTHDDMETHEIRPIQDTGPKSKTTLHQPTRTDSHHNMDYTTRRPLPCNNTTSTRSCNKSLPTRPK